MNALNHTAAARPASFDRSKQRYNSMLGKIHVGRKQINMADSDYRAALFERTGKLETNQCSEAELVKMIEFLVSKGFRPIPKPGKATATHKMARKARALWLSLYHLGAVTNPSEQALEAFAKRQLRCEKLVWAKQSDAFKLIEALKSWADRSGWRQAGLSSMQLNASLCEVILVRLKHVGLAPADWAIHDAQLKLCAIGEEGSGLRGAWTEDDYQRLAEALGAKLRSIGPARLAKLQKEMEALHG